MAELKVFDDVSALMRAAAEEIASLAGQAVAERGRFAWALSGGSTPRDLFRLLASGEYRDRMPWNAIHFFWGDERHVPPDHPDSNFRMAREAMLDAVPVPPENIHRVTAEEPAALRSHPARARQGRPYGVAVSGERGASRARAARGRAVGGGAEDVPRHADAAGVESRAARDVPGQRRGEGGGVARRARGAARAGALPGADRGRESIVDGGSTGGSPAESRRESLRTGTTLTPRGEA